MRPRTKKFVVMTCFLLGMVVLAATIPSHITHALEIQYPTDIPGFGNANTILNGNPTFGDVFQFIFTLALWMVGLFAFGSLLVFGFLYETSGPNPAKKLAAKMRFQGTLVGVLLLLGFTIILRTINPELTTLGNTTFNVCPSIGCPTVQVPSISVKLTYTIDSYKTTTAVLDLDPNRENARYLAAFNLTPGLAPCATINTCDLTLPGPSCPNTQIQDCNSVADYRSIEFFQNALSFVIDEARAAGINPVFAVAVWRAGTYESQGNNSFGCIASGQNVMDYKSFTDSFNCFKGSVAGSRDFKNWISNYCDPSHGDPLICHQRASFMNFLHQFYDNNAASGGSGLGLLPASDANASNSITPTDRASY